MSTGIFFNTKRERDEYHAAGGEFDFDFDASPFNRRSRAHKVTRLKKILYAETENKVLSKVAKT